MTAARTTRGFALVAWLASAIALGIVLTGFGSRSLVDSDVFIAAVLVGAFGVITWLAAGQQPGNRLTWVLAVFVASLSIFALGTAIRASIAPEVPLRLSVETYVPAEIPRGAAWVEMVALSAASFGQLTFLTFGLLLFPNGRLSSRRWRPVAIVSVLAVVGVLLLNLVVWSPGTTTAIADHPLFHLSSPFVLGLPVLALASVVMRFREAGTAERARMKWMIWGLSVFVPLVLFGTASGWGIVTAAAMLILVAAYGVSILRHRLFDVDLVISRTLVFGALAAFIGVVYVAVVVGIGALVGSADELNTGLAIAATAIVAVVFQPVRRRMERVANRVVFGRKATPYEVLSEFSQRVAATSDISFDEAARSLAEGTRAERVVISIRVDGEVIEAAAWPEAADDRASNVVRLPIEDAGAMLGSLEIHLDSGQELQGDDRRLAEQLASAMGLSLRNQLLTERLEARVEELRESRRRLVAVQDETRRRLERDLHDGAQQQLVALKVKLGLGRAIAEKEGAAGTAELLGRLGSAADNVVDAMRDFARGVYPPLLEAEGLAAALAAQARRWPIPVAVSTDGVVRYPREVEATVYFCVLEALRNTVQHAGADRATVDLSQSNGSLQFRVTDDGAGFDSDADRGSGLVTVNDRLDAVGGHLEIDTRPGRGTTITGSIPVPAEVPA